MTRSPWQLRRMLNRGSVIDHGSSVAHRCLIRPPKMSSVASRPVLPPSVPAAFSGGPLPEQDAALAAAAVLGLLVEGSIGPLAPQAAGRERELVQSLALTALRALGLADARARGLVVQTRLIDDAR